jgi:putative ABC transport system permease protein
VTNGRRFSPPRLAVRLLSIVSPAEDRPYLLADFEQEFEDRGNTSGVAAARAWYWREAIRSAAPLAARRVHLARRRPALSTSGVWTEVFGDMRYALRLSRRSPLAPLAIVATMTLGIAATAAVFAAANGVLLRPLPFPASERVVQLGTVVPNGNVAPTMAYPDALDYRRLVHEFSALTLFSRNDVTLQHGPDPENVRSLQVDESYARVFTLKPALGRLLVASDSVFGAPRVAVLSYGFWMREFGGDRSLVGRTIRLDDEPVTVVGVLSPDAYLFPRESVDLLTPLAIPPHSYMKNRGALWASAAAKLRPAASSEMAQRAVASVGDMLGRKYPTSNHGLSGRIKPLREVVVGSVRPMLELLAAAIVAVLLIACVNVANLILGRAQARSREFAVRSALGGSPARVRRQVFIEALVPAVIGSVLGLVLAPVLVHLLVAVYPDALPRADEIGIGAPVVLFVMAATIAAAALSCMPTARRVTRFDLSGDLRAGNGSGTRGERRASRVLVTTQVAMSLALLFSAGLLGETLWRLDQSRPGFDSHQTVAFHVYVPASRYRTVAEANGYYDRVLDAVRTIPGVNVASTTTLLPFGNCCNFDTFVQEDLGDQGPKNPQAFISVDSPGFERALGIPLLRGRAFTAHDDSASARVVMLNAAAAKAMYGNRDPIGELIDWNGQPHWRVVGVLAATHLMELSDEEKPVLYVPEAQAARRSRYVVVRGDAPANDVIAAARARLRAIDPTIALTDVATMDARIASSLGAERFRAVLMATLGALALALAIVGIYGVVAYSVSRRTREIGIRMALGEASHDVRRQVVIDALRVASAGLAIGLVLALLGGKWLAAFLVGVSPNDGRLLAATVGVLVAVVAATAYGPARRAAKVDPMTALRAD